MQIPILHEVLVDRTNERPGSPPDIPFGTALSIESQLKLRSLYQYVDFCELILGEVQRDLILFESGSDGAVHLQHASERLERFCLEADSWGFNAMYEIAISLQMLLFNAGSHIHTNGFWEALHRGLGMLSALLEQCERDFRWRLAAADTLDCLNKASEDLHDHA